MRTTEMVLIAPFLKTSNFYLPAYLYIYIIFERGLNVALKNSQFSLVFPFKPGNPGVHFNTAATFYKYQQTLQVYYK